MSRDQSEYPDWRHNRLKAIDALTLEEVIAKAVSELVDKDLRCSITQIDYSSGHFDATGAKFDVSLYVRDKTIEELLSERDQPAANTPQSDEQ